MTPRQKAALLFIALLSLSLRILFVHTVFEQSIAIPQDTLHAQNTTYIAQDSRMYIQRAFDALENNLLLAGNQRRTPGYPLFLAMLGISPFLVLFVQSILSALIPVGTYALLAKITNGSPLAFIAALCLSVHPSLIGVSGILVADALFCFLFASSVFAMWWATQAKNSLFFLLSGVLSALSLLVKPVLLFGILLFPILYVLLCKAYEQRIKISSLFSLVAPLVLTALSWSYINYTRTGMFTYSTIGTFTAHEYLGARVEAAHELGRLPTWDEMKAKRYAMRQAKAKQKRSMQEQVSFSRNDTLRILSRSPLLTLQCWALNIWENAFTGWDGFPNQLPLGVGSWSNVVLSGLYVEKYLRMLCFGLVLLALPFSLVAKEKKRQSAYLYLFFLTICVYFLILSGISFLSGTRLFLPAEFALLCCVTLTGALVYHRDR